MLPCLEPSRADRWVVAAGNNSTFGSLVGMKRKLIIAEFLRVCDLLAKRKGPLTNDCEQFLSFTEAVRARVLLHPSSVFWIRSTHRTLLDRSLRDSNGEELLLRASNHFRELLLSAALLEGVETETELELDRVGGFSLPGTGLALRAVGPPGGAVSIQFRFENGALALVVQKQRIQLTESNDNCIHLPAVELPDSSIELNTCDRRFVEDWIANGSYGGCQATPVRDESLIEWADRSCRAIEQLSELNAALAEEVAALICCLVPVVPPTADHCVSCSADDFFGACQVSALGSFELAEELAHEYRHNILNAILSFDPLILNDSKQEERLYSPWTNSYRPLLGIFHAIYSFQEVLALQLLWLAGHPKDHKYEERVAIQSARLSYVLPKLGKSVETTLLGTALIKAIEDRVSPLIDEAAKSWPRLFELAQAQIVNNERRASMGRPS